MITRLHSAETTKAMLGNMGIERVSNKLVLSRKQFEARGRNDEVMIVLHGADGAVAMPDE